MKYSDYYDSLPPERQRLLYKLTELALNAGKAQREGDWDMAKQLDSEICKIYEEIGEDDGRPKR